MARELTVGELQKLIEDIVGKTVEPLKEQQTQWANKLFEEKKEQPREKGAIAARIVRALAANKGDVEKASAYAKKVWGDDEVAKALSAGTSTSGGYIVPPEYSTEIIELLRPASVVRRMGAVTIPMDTGTLHIPRLASGAQATYIGENTAIGETTLTFDEVVLTWKKLAALVPISNDLLRFSNPSADVIVRDDLVNAMAQREDLAFIRGGGGTEPKGLFGWAPDANKIPSTGTTLQAVTNDLAAAVLALKKNNVRFIRPGWLMSPRSEMYLMALRDSNGNYAFRDEMLAGRLFGYPYAVTTQIPENLGTGTNTNESELYLVDFADAIIGEATQLIIDASSEAAYVSGGNVVSAYSLDQTVIRVIAEHDFAVRHPESVAVITGLTWGA